MNYATLFETIKGYVENDFPNQDWTSPAGNSTVTFTQKEQIDTFIQQAEQRIYNSVQLPVFRKNVTGLVTTGNKYLNVPTDWLATFSLAVIHPVTQIQTFLLNKDVEFIREAFPPPDVLGTPQYYAIFDDTTFILGPTPDAGYNMELHYFGYPVSIVTAVSGTTLTAANHTLRKGDTVKFGVTSYTVTKVKGDTFNLGTLSLTTGTYKRVLVRNVKQMQSEQQSTLHFELQQFDLQSRLPTVS
jgi:hypothetical protein